MKKIYIIVAFLMICLLAGCQSTGSTTTEQPSTNPSPAETEENTPTPSPNPTPDTTETAVPQREDADFRNAKWGDDKETVIEYEADVDLIESDDALVGEANAGGYDTLVIYYFDDDKLYETAYAFSEVLNFSNAGQYIPVYNSLKETLTTKYGTPIMDRIIPMESQDLIDYAGEASALEYGYVTYVAQWETETTDIMMGMSAINFEINLVIIYTDKNYEPDINDSGL